MNRFLQAVERSRLAEQEASLASRPGRALPKGVETEKDPQAAADLALRRIESAREVRRLVQSGLTLAEVAEKLRLEDGEALRLWRTAKWRGLK